MVEFVLILAAAEPRLHGWRFSPEELGKLLKSEIARWGALIKSVGIKLD